MKTQYIGLVGDVGGTNARFALVDTDGRVRNLHVYQARDYASLADVIADYLERALGRRRPPRAVIAVAGPVLDGEITFTNLDWQVSEGDLLATFEFEAVRLLNDFAAQALACPRLERENLKPIGPVLRGAGPDCPLVVLGAGTGFGVAGLAHGGVQHRARAHHRALDLGDHGLDAGGSRGCAEGDLQHGQAAGHQGAAQRHGVGHIVDHQHRDHRRAAEDLLEGHSRSICSSSRAAPNSAG